ncbi:MAG: ABC transporter ATP-binding protein [Oscillospiraceae bacterium]|nr:ABC transporter ATP-binding protein [Oscillospiraceae bacterium]
MNAIEIRNLTKSYGDFTLGGLSLTLPTGCILGLVGENGAGKSTTIRLLLGMTEPDGGKAALLGTDIAGDLTAVKEEIGVVMDEPGLPHCMTAEQVGKMMTGIYRNWDAAAFTALLTRLDIPAAKPFKELSRGNRMKLGIAIALAHKPRLLLLDEPTSGLDPVARDEVVRLLSDFTRDETHAVLISSHIVSDLEKLCDYIAFLHKGQLMLREEKDVLLEEYGLLRCTAATLATVDPAAVIGKKESPYGVAAIVRRTALPAGVTVSPVTLEELFVFMVKEERDESAAV